MELQDLFNQIDVLHSMQPAVVSPAILPTTTEPLFEHLGSSVPPETLAIDGGLQLSSTLLPPPFTARIEADCVLGWPLSIPIPPQELKCPCADHMEKVEVDVVVPCSAKALFTKMFLEAEFFQTLHVKRNEKSVEIQEWSSPAPPTEGMSRVCKFYVPINNPMMKAKETECIETHTLTALQNHLVYIVQMKGRTPSVPFGDTFHTNQRVCFTFVSKTSCRLKISVGVHFVKNTMMKGLIRS